MATPTTTPPTPTPTQLWYHDAADHEVPTVSNTLSQGGEAKAEAHLYGVCMVCGIGLDDVNDFFYDRREKQCDCFTCNKCFETTFGKDELFNTVNWKTLGIHEPQYIRVTW